MKSIALLAVLCLSTPTALAADMATPVAKDLPQTLTRSGHQFVAHCSDDDFARARFPQKLARKCTSLLRSWQSEASGRDDKIGPPTGGIARFGAPRGIPFAPPPPPRGD
jgi:hypothetical protein